MIRAVQITKASCRVLHGLYWQGAAPWAREENTHSLNGPHVPFDVCPRAPLMLMMLGLCPLGVWEFGVESLGDWG